MLRRKKVRKTKTHLFLLVSAIFFFAGGVTLLWAATLQVPDLKTFDQRKIIQSTKIYDRTGEVLLYDIHENIQRTVVPFDKISRNMKNATVAIEDVEFYEHSGIQPSAILRATLVNIGALGFEQGGSTITQQVVKNSLLTHEKTIARKLKEWALALKLEQKITKEKILELYLNEVTYGGNVYGIEEASRTYFGKPSRDLSLVESAYLAALPQAPTYYLNNKEKLEKRKNLVLERMRGLRFISQEEYESALNQDISFSQQISRGIKAPHFVFYVREQLEKKYGKDAIETGGLQVITTIDYSLQRKAEEILDRFAEENEEKFNATNASLVAIDPVSGHILTMVGSRDYFDKEIEGNFNVATAHRQPGSIFKPFVYATAFMKGYTPDTVVFDLETQFSTECDAKGEPLNPETDPGVCYQPQNYDEVFRGPVTLLEALAQSINIPSIKTLYLAGLRDSLKTAQKMGIKSLTDPNRYGLTLVLGGGEVTLLEITGAYATFANEGKHIPYTAILEVRDKNGNTLEKFKPQPVQAIPRKVALQVSDILSDNEARAPAFGQYSPLYFSSHDVAAKTGTTNDFRDAWIIGYTPKIAVGAWAGNNDNTPMEKRVAGFTVAPMWNAFMKEVLRGIPYEPFSDPPRENNTDDLKPMLRGKWEGSESFFVDTISGKLATEYTPEETKEERFVANVHSILYWLYKDDPRGPKPEDPLQNPQFELWEKPVRNWVKEQKIREGVRDNIPEEYDDIHKPELAPRIKIKGFNENIYHPRERKIDVRVDQIGGRFPIQKVDLFINGIYVASSRNKPYLISFVPKNLDFLKKENVLRVVAHDTVLNKTNIELPFAVAN